jgi:hypothetical protein
MLLPLHHVRNRAGEEGEDGTVKDMDSSVGSSIPPHPLGIKPLGNKYFAGGNDARKSLGVLQLLPDEVLMQLLECLDATSLGLLSATCKFLFACCTADDIWKSIFFT